MDSSQSNPSVNSTQEHNGFPSVSVQKSYKNVLVIVGIILVVLVVLGALLLNSFPYKKQSAFPLVQPSITPTPTVLLKTEYDNPFDEKSNYDNPFSESKDYKNPFDTGQ